MHGNTKLKLIINNLHLQTLNFISAAPTFTRLHSITFPPAESQPLIYSAVTWNEGTYQQCSFGACQTNLQARWKLWAGATDRDQTWPRVLNTCESFGGLTDRRNWDGAVNALCRSHTMCYLLQAYAYESNLLVKTKETVHFRTDVYMNCRLLFWSEEFPWLFSECF